MAKQFKYVDNATGLDFEAEGYESSDYTNTGGAGNENKPLLTDASGLLDSSLINVGAIDHNSLDGRVGIDTHPDFLDLTGTRAMTGALNMNTNLINGVATPVSSNDAVNKAYADALAVGNRAKGNVVAASIANLALTGIQTIDGQAVAVGDRVLVKDQTDATENGIYIAATGAWVRSEDLDNQPQAEIVNGVLIPVVLNGTVNGGRPFFISSVGTGVDGVHTVGTDDIVWELFTSPTQLQPGEGIALDGNIINVDLIAATSSLLFNANKLGIDFATAITDAKPWKASDLTAAYLPIVDAGNFTTEIEVEGALQELYGLISQSGVEYLVGTGGCTKGDLARISGDNTTLPYSDTNNAHRGIGLFLETKAAGETVKVLANDTIISGVLSGATAGVPYYWNGTTLVDSVPSGSGTFVWQVGVAKNATDLHVEVRFVKKNA
ncbi:MAG: hypothetical protein KAG61_03615 [Bacteriovoracaceae bacterium]|nr:hypothetical protein [Bacteriovoracaceae bacterium]